MGAAAVLRGGGRRWNGEFAVEQYRTRCWDFTAKHFTRLCRPSTPFALSYSWTKPVLQSPGLAAAAPRRSAYRKKRPRRPLPARCCSEACPREAGAAGHTNAWQARALLGLIVTRGDAAMRRARYTIFMVEE